MDFDTGKWIERFWTVDGAPFTSEKEEIRIKESYLNGSLANYQPEHEDCKKAAEKLKRPIKDVMAQAIHLYLSKK